MPRHIRRRAGLAGWSAGTAVVLGLWAVACGDGSTAPPVPPVPPMPPMPTNQSPAVSATIPAATLNLGDTLRVDLSAHFRDPDGDGLSFAAESSDAAVASVSVSGSALTAVAVGRGTASVGVTATDPGSLSASQSFQVTVPNRAPVVADSIPDAETFKGDTLRLDLSAHFSDPDGDSLSFAAETSDEAVATVAVSGDTLALVAVGAGGATITATAGDSDGLEVSQDFMVTITVKITSVVVAPDSLTLTALEEMVQLSAKVFEASGDAVPEAAVSWSSEDIAVATVDDEGVVTATGRGETTIAAAAGGVSGLAVVSVAPAVHAIAVTPSGATIVPGDSVRLMAAATDRNGYPVAGAELVWSSSDSGVATVEASDPPVTALVRGVGEGSATITVSAGDVEGRARVTVSGDGDRFTLSKLYEATGGPNWDESINWLTDAPLGTWHGVQVDSEGRVTRLWLGDNGLVGPIPPELGSLARLRTLDLKENNLRGAVPPELGSLSSLEELLLHANLGLTGPIPTELGSLAGLTELSLHGNRLTGPIPPELGSLRNLSILSLSANELAGPIPPELGLLRRLEGLWLSRARLTGPIPPELGSMPSLVALDLSENDLTGAIPPELANLPELQLLRLDRNELTGPIPRDLLGLGGLSYLRFHENGVGGEHGLCAPGTRDFVAWLEEIEQTSGPFCSVADMEGLTSLYEAAGGNQWTIRSGWLGGAALGEWYGVTADSLGRVVALDLSANGLIGGFTPPLARLEHMLELRIDGNALSGRLPLDLARLTLREFHYADTQLCAPSDAAFQAWLGGIASHQGTGLACDAPTDRDVLVAFYHSTGGPAWINNDNWLTDAAIGEWTGVTVDERGRVTGLQLPLNNLTGSIPPELASLRTLEFLNLLSQKFIIAGAENNLSGPIPPELGSLPSLEYLYLSNNQLTGPIPAEFGSSPRLAALLLDNNRLTGPIPTELGSSPGLTWLDLSHNDLTGPVPPELASLGDLISLELSDNRLTGPIPPELGNLSQLQRLDLAANDLTGSIPSDLARPVKLQELLLQRNGLTGSVPSELGNLGELTRLLLSGNAGLSGPLPGSLTALRQLEEFQAGDTGLCAPSDLGFGDWLRGVLLSRVESCEGASSMAYLTQGAQSRAFPVPLVAGREALLRVFVTATSSASATMPPVRATFFVDGAEIHATNIPRGAQPIPTEIDESSLSTSANMRIPGRVVQPGLEMVIEVDPAGTLDPSVGVKKRIPESGRIALVVHEMPVLDLTMIPFLWTEDPDSSIVAIVRDMAADSERRLAPVHTLLPVRDLVVTPHEPVWISSRDTDHLLTRTQAIRVMEGGSGYYMGMLPEAASPTPYVGRAYQPGRSSFSIADSATIVHELGHNLNLDHAPCGSPGAPDPSFPQANGSIGIWGYDFRDGGRLVPPSAADFMSFCHPTWTSDFDFAKALSYRATYEAESRPATAAAPHQSLLLWGGADAAGEPFLEPAFVVDAPPSLPAGGGDYRLEGTDAEGRALFSLSFDMPEVADGDGRAGFVFALPVRAEWAGALAAITLNGPDGSVTLNGESERASAILRDPRSGQVRGILRDLPGDGSLMAAATAAAAELAGASGELEVRVSRGVPDAAAWRR